MDAANALLDQFGTAFVHLLAQPFYYIAVLFIILQYTRQISLERRMFAVRLHIWPRLVAKAMLVGLVAGLLASVVGAFIGISLTGDAVLWLWGSAAVLLVFRIRYLCFAYGAGVLALLQWMIGFTPLEDNGGWIGDMASSLAGLDMPGILVLVALLHLVEAFLVRRQGDKLATPLFVEGKRGKLVGGYMLQGFWPVPMLLLVPAAGSASAVDLPWTPLFGGDWTQGWSVVALPMIIGFSEMTRTMLPSAKARHAAKGLLWYSLLLTGAALLAWWLPALLPVAALCSLLMHEAIIWRSRVVESAQSPLYVNDQRGLRILGIVPGTPAEAMKLSPGEIIAKVNGNRVYSKEDLHESLQNNSGMYKLEVLNQEGEIKFVQRARYEGEHHQLGVILSPDERATYYASSEVATLLDLLRRARTAKRRGRAFVEEDDTTGTLNV
ncbi:PDZ domain-containing protein [Paenibacillus glycanilyticus]|uniref:Cell division topological determinant MinJ n=1 Tax=Paenibacillus glycanilyticus TaxID=126569 RepID=A0ABQ6GPG5_9BACL|nr:PDZ domain-containing protein [Paenibacillus glycanilyticus]GLX70912.1 cell division topological determinant MinJ [Paenibacillus glycanilyticus]